MFYEEKLINGILMFRNTPTDNWQQYSIEKMSQRIEEAKELRHVTIALLKYINALPEDVVAALPAMPGIDRDYVDMVLDR